MLLLAGGLAGGAMGACGEDGSSGGDPEGGAPDAPSAPDAPPVQPDLDAGGGADADAGIAPCRGVPLPKGSHFVAPGMCATVVAQGLGNLRQITFSPDGELLGATKDGAVLRFRDADHDGVYAPGEITTWADTGGNTNDVVVSAGYLYAGTPLGVKRWPYGFAMDAGGAGEDVITDIPLGGHFHHTVKEYDGFLYVHSGSFDDQTNPHSPAYDHERSVIRRFPLASFTPGSPLTWLSGEIVVQGLRNANGIARRSVGGIYAVDMGMDVLRRDGVDVSQDNPGEMIVQVTSGKQYGYPFCFAAQRVLRDGGAVVPPGTMLFNEMFGVHDDAWCAANASPPASFLQAHAAPLDLTFFEPHHPKGGLPERFRGGAFIALHGSTNRSVPTGYKVVWLPFDVNDVPPMPTATAAGTTFPYETVFGGGDASGPVDGKWTWSVAPIGESPRPSGVVVSPVDGALYVASDESGYVYRVQLAP